MKGLAVYPTVIGEEATLDAVLAGRSLARYGDGEFKLCRGGGIKSQAFDKGLQARLRGILHASADCLVGIPNIWAPTPKRAFWMNYRQAADLLVDRPYASAFVTRPDSAPWIDTPAYWAKVESLWVDQEVTLVRGSTKSLTAADLVGAAGVTEIVAERADAWSYYDELVKAVGRPPRAILCLGPTATVMAVDLCAAGVHAIDLGHIGMFLRKHRRGVPMWLTKEDKHS